MDKNLESSWYFFKATDGDKEGRRDVFPKFNFGELNLLPSTQKVINIARAMNFIMTERCHPPDKLNNFFNLT